MKINFFLDFTFNGIASVKLMRTELLNDLTPEDFAEFLSSLSGTNHGVDAFESRHLRHLEIVYRHTC